MTATIFKEKHRGQLLMSAALMVAALIFLIVYISVQSESSKYRDAYISLDSALEIETASSIGNAADIYDWMDSVIKNAVPTYSAMIDTNCPFDDYNPNSCNIYNWTEGHDDMVYLTGNHNLIFFSYAMSRAPPARVEKRDSFKTSTYENVGGEAAAVDACQDPKYVQVSVDDWDNMCVIKDGFEGQQGSTLHFARKDDQDYFDMESSATAVLARLWEDYKLVELTPCDPTVKQRDLRNMYTINGYKARMGCNALLQENSLYGFRMHLVELFNEPSYTTLINKFYNCDYFMSDLSPNELSSNFLLLPTVSELKLNDATYVGTFANAISQSEWSFDATKTMMDLRMANSIDRYARKFVVRILTSEVSSFSRYYSSTQLTFSFTSDGNVRFTKNIQFVPIIHYYYGIEGYPLKYPAVVCLESILLIFWTILLGSIVYQLTLLFTSSEGDKYSLIWKEFILNVKAVIDYGKLLVGLLCSGCGSPFQKVGPIEEGERAVDTKSSRNLSNFDIALRNFILLLILDCATFIGMAFVIYFRIKLIAASVRLHNQVVHSEGDDLANSKVIGKLIDSFDEISNEQEYFRTMLTWVMMLFLVQFLRHLSCYKGLSVVTDTLNRASSSLGPLMFVFLTVFLAYGATGYMLFGTSIEDFSSLGLSMAQLFTLLLENVDYGELHSIAKSAADVFYWSFVFIMFFLLLNMVLGVVLGAHGEIMEEEKEIREQMKQEEEREVEKVPEQDSIVPLKLGGAGGEGDEGDHF